MIALDERQINDFAGNAIELSTDSGRVLGMSARILPLSVPTIERAGGSVRCMLAGIHLTRR